MRTFALLLMLVLSACAGLEPRPEVTKEHVVELARSGADAKWIIDRLRETGTVLMLSAGDIVSMHRDGVPQEVLDWLQAVQIAEIRRREAMFIHMYGDPFARCTWPQHLLFHPRQRWHYSPWPGC